MTCKEDLYQQQTELNVCNAALVVKKAVKCEP